MVWYRLPPSTSKNGLHQENLQLYCSTGKNRLLGVNRMAFELIIFDCDGVLVDSEPLATAVMAEMARELGLPIHAEEAFDRFVGRNVEQCVAEIEAELNRPIPENFMREFRRRSAEKFEANLSPVPGVRSILDRISTPYCLASSAPLSKIHLTLTVTDLLGYFDGKIFSGYEVGSWKPDPGLFLAAASYYNVPPVQCAVIEDSNAGVQAGLAAGMNVFHYNPKLEINPTKDGKVVSFRNMRDLITLLQV